MRKTILTFMAGVLLATIASSTALMASPEMRQLFFGVNVVVDGRPLQLDGIDRPFIMDGRTFLPVSVIARELGVPTTWDGDTMTVFVGQIAGMPDNHLHNIQHTNVVRGRTSHGVERITNPITDIQGNVHTNGINLR
ncbi:MAG: copper amine oxidase N-terminal domain-containing protein [Defluviitaleaceae bacterium]|nr:copper amine oxidase N-terminal domain-containing protein [Defluviitaleaceae bacterium]